MHLIEKENKKEETNIVLIKILVLNKWVYRID